MKRVAIIAKGRVQREGYRDEVEEIARKLKITGFVENVKPYGGCPTIQKRAKKKG